jgi:poly [ADP-ribose] polymerase
MEYKYLVMVTSDNHNKYYEMIPEGNSFTVKYGRVGASPQVRSYSDYEFDKKYNEKLRKGYIDQTDLRKDLIQVSKNEGKSKYVPIKDQEIKELIDYLQKVARQKIADNYIISTEKVTQAMVNEAQEVLNELADIYEKDISDKQKQFNDLLLKLFNILPRKMSYVSEYLANNDKQETFAKIYSREQELLNVMKGQVIQQTKQEEVEVQEEPTQTILEANGLILEPISEEDKKIILKELGEIKDKFYKAWRVTNKVTRERFENEISHANNKTTRLLWHGSKNENWFSIMSNGLLLNPNAAITGKLYRNWHIFCP